MRFGLLSCEYSVHKDKRPNLQHLVFLDVKEVASVGQKQPINTLCTLDVKILRQGF